MTSISLLVYFDQIYLYTHLRPLLILTCYSNSIQDVLCLSPISTHPLTYVISTLMPKPTNYLHLLALQHQNSFFFWQNSYPISFLFYFLKICTQMLCLTTNIYNMYIFNLKLPNTIIDVKPRAVTIWECKGQFWLLKVD